MAFYVIMIGLPVTGWIIVSTSKLTIPTVLYGAIPWPHLPFLPELAAGPKHLWHEIGENAHGLLVKTTICCWPCTWARWPSTRILDRDEVLGQHDAG